MASILEWMANRGHKLPHSTPEPRPLTQDEIDAATESGKKQDWLDFQRLYGTPNPLDGQAAAWRAYFAGRDPTPPIIPDAEQVEELLYEILQRANPNRGDTGASRQNGWEALHEWYARRK